MSSSRNADLTELRATVDRLVAENATLRDQLRTVGSGLPVLPADTPVTKAAPIPKQNRRRRWMGNAIGALLLVLGFALGALYVARLAPATADGFRRGYDDGAAAARARKAEPVTSPAPMPSPAPSAPTPSASPLP